MVEMPHTSDPGWQQSLGIVMTQPVASAYLWLIIRDEWNDSGPGNRRAIWIERRIPFRHPLGALMVTKIQIFGTECWLRTRVWPTPVPRVCRVSQPAPCSECSVTAKSASNNTADKARLPTSNRLDPSRRVIRLLCVTYRCVCVFGVH